MERQEAMYEYWFANVKGISGKKKQECREKGLSARDIYNIEERRLKAMDFLTDKMAEALTAAKKTEPERMYEALEKTGIQFLPYFAESYPKQLTKLSDMPYAIYVKGRPYHDEYRTVAIVGARACSPYGETMAIQFAKELSKAGVQIVSGLARGVDCAAQRGALYADGISYGVLGCGADICYPRENIGLYMNLQEQGGLISEYPPGTPPFPSNFPMRNRIISALADVVLVMEARTKSGSLITADQALEQGKEVYALPGPVNSVLSEGCNRLIRQGAGILTTPEDLLSDMSILPSCKGKKEIKKEIKLESRENMVYSCLDLYPKNVGELVTETGIPIQVLTGLLVSLELRGYIREIAKNYYVKINQTM